MDISFETRICWVAGLVVLGWEMCQPVVVSLGKDVVLTHPFIWLLFFFL